MSDLKMLKKIYDRLGNDFVRSKVLSSAELFGVRKDVLRMDTNNYCNIRCIMCNRDHTAGEKHFMPLENYTAIIDKFAPKLRNLYLSCACEPLATPHFAEYLKYAKLKGIPHVSFCTNALLLNQDIIAAAVDHNVNEIIVSFNGFNRADYNRIMSGSDFDKVCDNIKSFNQYKASNQKEAVRNRKPLLRLNTVLLKANLSQPEALIAFVRENDVKTVQFRDLIALENQNNPCAVKAELLTATDVKYQELLENARYIADALRSHNIEVILPLSVLDGQPAASDHSRHAVSSSPKAASAARHTCSVPFFSYWIDWEGNVRVCGYDEKGIIGNALSEDPDRLKEQRKSFQKLALRGECSSELCTMNINTSSIL